MLTFEEEDDDVEASELEVSRVSSFQKSSTGQVLLSQSIHFLISTRVYMCKS